VVAFKFDIGVVVAQLRELAIAELNEGVEVDGVGQHLESSARERQSLLLETGHVSIIALDLA
jgi:hypothetical protein